MGQLLAKQAEETAGLYQETRDMAVGVISKITSKQLIDKPEETLRATREEIDVELIPLMKESFLLGRKHAYQIMRAAGVTGIPKDSDEFNAEEKKELTRLFGVWSSDMQSQNLEFAVSLKRWANQLRATDMSRPAMIIAFDSDWNGISNTGRPNGRWTSQWKNGVPDSAGEFINKVELAGQEAGYLGTGQGV